ncbi:MAG: 6-bladed beta-propeller [Dysgonomonas sp.]
MSLIDKSILFIFFISCSNNKIIPIENEQICDININVNNVKESYDIATQVEQDFEIIPLATNDSCLIGGAFKVIFKNNIFYILDKLSNQVVLFDQSGKYISKLHRVGQGPEEYIRIEDFIVVDKDIWICDNSIKKLICYDENYNVTDIVNNGSWVYGIEYKKPYIYMVNNWIPTEENNYQLRIYSTENKKIKSLFSFDNLDDNAQHMGIRRQIAHSGDSPLFIVSYNDAIYEINDNTFLAKYKFNFSERFYSKPLKVDEKRNPDHITGIVELVETPRSIILLYVENRESRYAVYNKKEKVCNIYSELINSDFSNMILHPESLDQNEFIAIKDPLELLNFYSRKEFINGHFANKSKEKEYKDILLTLKEDDNPIIFRFKFKKDAKL